MCAPSSRPSATARPTWAPSSRTLSLNEDGTEVGVVQIHPDAASMEFHVAVVAERAARGYAQTLEATPASRFYGEPREAVLEILRRQVAAGFPMPVNRN